MTATALFTASYGLLWGLVIVQGALLLGVVRKLYLLQRFGLRDNAPLTTAERRGEEVPAFKVRTLAGSTVNSRDLLGTPYALAFVSPDCPSCAVSLVELQALELKAQGRVFVVCRSTPDACDDLVRKHSVVSTVILDSDNALSESLGVRTVPSAVIVDRNGRIQSVGQPLREDDLPYLAEADEDLDEPDFGSQAERNDLVEASHVD